ncbi:hypothetical protein O53_5254 [Microcystis aeruginosa TAIHU98]|uniref:Uncharacterized protein n=2 Tax=Microcystis aeruginosa TaxID=1126 RepID=L7DZW8_MICAE|nr:hypothetical protein BH695_2076 [Microcystis aeruginosa PCC 7806SL]ELP52359.1 hypothetical protein O53_5254 [Microcystis aeruginosa TAIHU98]ODV37819.1 hypothetical protein BFG60_2791 [Microcystis aeruginosa NIES-98]
MIKLGVLSEFIGENRVFNQDPTLIITELALRALEQSF